MRHKINHPKADAISVIYDYAGEEATREIAFFRGGEWVVDPIEPFVVYMDYMQDHDTAVYRHVPLVLVEEFLEVNGA